MNLISLPSQLHLSERNIIRSSMRRGTSPDQHAAAVRDALADRLDALFDTLAADADAPTGYGGIPARYTVPTTRNIHFITAVI